MDLVGLGLSIVISVAASVGSAVPVAAWQRTREPRFLLLATASLALLLVGILGAWARVVANPPTYAEISTTFLALLSLAALLLLATGLIPRRT